MQPTKSRSATRRIWRMTAENQLGEILELPGESTTGRIRPGARAGCSESKQVASPASFHDATGFASRSVGESRSPASKVTSSASLSTWRASSYDLLKGLTVRDVSERIPERTFEALFTTDAASRKRGDRS